MVLATGLFTSQGLCGCASLCEALRPIPVRCVEARIPAPGASRRLNSAVLFLSPCQYEVKAPVPSPCFRNICKQMTKMHEAIFDLLPEEQTQMLFLRINASYKFHLKKQLSHLNVINDGGPQNG